MLLRNVPAVKAAAVHEAKAFYNEARVREWTRHLDEEKERRELGKAYEAAKNRQMPAEMKELLKPLEALLAAAEVEKPPTTNEVFFASEVIGAGTLRIAALK